MSIVAAILVLGALIVVHEFGHFLVAKRLGVGVLRFSVGFGPRLLARTWRGTEYALSAIPLGGYVKMAGEDPDALERGDEVVDPAISFSHQALWKRTAIVFAGPAFNVLFAFVALAGAYLVLGVPSDTATIGAVQAGRPAAEAGVRAGDVVVAVDGAPVADWAALSEAVRRSAGEPLQVTVRRGEARHDVTVRPEHRPELVGEADKAEAYFIGVELGREPVGMLRAANLGAYETWLITKVIVVSLAKLVQGEVSAEDIGGPIAIVQQAGVHADRGLEWLVRFMALISINLGILNLLPVPILDGGHLLFFVFEAVMRRPLDIRHRELAQQIGLVFLVSLMVFVFYNDIARLVRDWG